MSSSNRGKAAGRYANYRYEAHQATMKTLAGTVPPFRLSDITHTVLSAWDSTWKPINAREMPNGGWDWHEIRWRYRSEVKRFELAIWSDDDQLCGLAIGTVNKTAAKMDLIESHPDHTHPLKGQILLIGLEALACYAQKTGREEIWLIEPAEGLIETYETIFGFTLETPRKGTPYCRRRV